MKNFVIKDDFWILLIPVGLLFYKERFSIINITGFLLCLAGIFLVSRS